MLRWPGQRSYPRPLQSSARPLWGAGEGGATGEGDPRCEILEGYNNLFFMLQRHVTDTPVVTCLLLNIAIAKQGHFKSCCKTETRCIHIIFAPIIYLDMISQQQ